MQKIKEKPYLALNKRRCFNLKLKLKQEDTLWKSTWTKTWLFYKKKSICTLQILREFRAWCPDLPSQRENRPMNSEETRKNQERLKHSSVKQRRFNQARWLLLIRLNPTAKANPWKELPWCPVVEVHLVHKQEALSSKWFCSVNKLQPKEASIWPKVALTTLWDHHKVATSVQFSLWNICLKLAQLLLLKLP